jgi:hypothetical protein
MVCSSDFREASISKVDAGLRLEDGAMNCPCNTSANLPFALWAQHKIGQTGIRMA